MHKHRDTISELGRRGAIAFLQPHEQAFMRATAMIMITGKITASPSGFVLGLLQQQLPDARQRQRLHRHTQRRRVALPRHTISTDRGTVQLNACISRFRAGHHLNDTANHAKVIVPKRRRMHRHHAPSGRSFVRAAWRCPCRARRRCRRGCSRSCRSRWGYLASVPW